MKKIILAGLILAVFLFAACANSTEGFDAEETDETQAYAFEFKDLDGNVHRLSDYNGMPVYLRVWGSWCSVCVSTLDKLDALSADAEDYVVLTVVTPGVAGEMSKEDFAEWFEPMGYDNIVVLIDDKAQIVDDFHIQAYPSQVFFDENGNYITYMMGAIGQDMIDATFKARDRIE